MLTDAVLVERVIAGFDDAFDELYRRHATAAWRLGQAVTGNPHDAADAVSEAFARVLQAVRTGRLADGDAFRSYLLTATRNAALDGMRRAGRSRPAADDELSSLESGSPSPDDKMTLATDAALIAAAFRNLPERWRSVLWLTEVEGIATKDAAEQLGLSPNGAAQLAVRARAGLRERYLQAHLKDVEAADCRFAVDRLGAYVGGGLAARDLAKVDQHLAGCEDCAARKAELEDVGTSLRRIALPIPLGLAGMAGHRVHEALLTSSAGSAGVGARVLGWAQEPTPLMRRLVGASAAGVLGLGVLAATFVGGPQAVADDLAAPRTNTALRDLALPDAVIAGSTLDLPSTSGGTVSRFARPDGVPASSGIRIGPASPAAPASGQPGDDQQAAAPSAPAATRPDDDGTDNPIVANPLADVLPPLPAEPVAEVTVGGRLGDDTVVAEVEVSEEPEVAVEVGPIVVGEPEPAPEEDGLQIDLGTPLGDQSIQLP